MKQKLIALLLATAMMTSMSVTAWASDSLGTDIEGNDIAGYSDDDAVTVTLTLSKGEGYLTNIDDEAMVMQELTVPYFDLANYGLEKFYYNPDGYQPDGNSWMFVPAESADVAEGHVTMLHALIYATEIYYAGIPADEAGLGAIAYDLENLVGYSQTSTPGSTFLLNFWDTNTGGSLMYYVNNDYPMGISNDYVRIGASADQVKLEDGDHIHLHIMDYYGEKYFTSFGIFESDVDGNIKTVSPGEIVDVTLNSRWTDIWGMMSGPMESYTEALPYSEIYITQDRSLAWDEWDYLGDTDDSGNFQIDTSELEPGTYYLSSIMTYQEGNGQMAEYAPATFTLIIEDDNESQDPAPSILYGDANGDGAVDYRDAVLVLNYEVGNISEIDTAAADMNQDGQITYQDAVLILNADVNQ